MLRALVSEKARRFWGMKEVKNFNNIDPRDINSAMTPQNYRLLPQYFLGFALKNEILE
jgi:hypothetical protein